VLVPFDSALAYRAIRVTGRLLRRVLGSAACRRRDFSTAC
jgi:hypothetical protein